MLQTLVSGLVSGSIYGILALGIVIVYRGSRVLNFAQAELGTLGLYVAYWVHVERGLPWVVGFLAACVAVGAISAGFERWVVRSLVHAPRVTVAVATVGFLLLLLALEQKVFDGADARFLPGPVTGTAFTAFDFVVSWTQVIGFVVALAVGLGLNAFLRKTDFGLGVLAAAQDPVAVRMMGISYARVSSFTWVAAGVLGTLAVMFVEPTVGGFVPGRFSLGANAIFIPALAAALIGRLDNLTHAFLGGLAVGIVMEAVATIFISSSIPGLVSVSLFVLIVAALYLRAPVAQLKGEAA